METPIMVSMHETESYKMVADSAKEFAEKHLGPHVMEWDEKQHFPVDVISGAGIGTLIGLLMGYIFKHFFSTELWKSGR